MHVDIVWTLNDGGQLKEVDVEGGIPYSKIKLRNVMTRLGTPPVPPP